MFLSALRHVAARGKAKPDREPDPADPIPLPAWFEAAKARMADVAKLTGKPDPEPKMSGDPPAEVVAVNPADPAPKRFAVPAAPKGADPEVVAKVVKLLDLPPIREPKLGGGEDPARPGAPVPGRGHGRVPGRPGDGRRSRQGEGPQGGHGHAGNDPPAVEALSGDGGGLLDVFDSDSDDAVKKLIVKQQVAPAKAILKLEDRVKEMEPMLADLDDKEPSKFWRATFRYALAEAKARLAFVNEYNFALGNIRTDALPPRKEMNGRKQGLQLVSTVKMKSKKDIQEGAEGAKALFATVAEENKDTPWAVLAKRGKSVALGLSWQASVAAP